MSVARGEFVTDDGMTDDAQRDANADETVVGILTLEHLMKEEAEEYKNMNR